MKTKDEILEELRNEVKSNNENESKKRSKKQIDKLKRKWVNYFLVVLLITTIGFLASVVIVYQFKLMNTISFLFIGALVYMIPLVVFVLFVMNKAVDRYIKKHLVLPVITIDIDEEVKKLINTKLIDLTNEVFDLDLALSETKEELSLLEEIQKEKN